MSKAATRPVVSWHMILEFSVPLLAGVACALAWTNIAPHSYHDAMTWRPIGGHVDLEFVVNEVFMVFFFAIATKEITEACLPGGPLNPPKRAINPLLGTLGGVLGPIGFFFLYLWIAGDQGPANGWGVPTATDIALAWLVARVAFGKGHPAVSFLLLLAVADDGIGLAIIAIFYPDPAHPAEPLFLLLVLTAMIGAFALRKYNAKNFWAYLLGPGLLSWCGLVLAHLHPALALVPIIPFLPSSGKDLGLFSELDDNSRKDPLNRFEHFFKIPVEFGLFFFGLANAGVSVSTVGTATWAVLLALVVGKSVGVVLFSGLAHLAGFELAKGMDFRSLVVAGMIAGMGLTVALFVAGVAFTDPGLQGAAKMGALLSAFSAPLAIAVAALLRVRHRACVQPADRRHIGN